MKRRTFLQALALSVGSIPLLGRLVRGEAAEEEPLKTFFLYISENHPPIEVRQYRSALSDGFSMRVWCDGVEWMQMPVDRGGWKIVHGGSEKWHGAARLKLIGVGDLLVDWFMVCDDADYVGTIVKSKIQERHDRALASKWYMSFVNRLDDFRPFCDLGRHLDDVAHG